jgi:hypothetical protein
MMLSFAPQTSKNPGSLTQLASVAEYNSRFLQTDLKRRYESIALNAQIGAAAIRNSDPHTTLTANVSALVACRNAIISLIGEDD